MKWTREGVEVRIETDNATYKLIQLAADIPWTGMEMGSVQGGFALYEILDGQERCIHTFGDSIEEAQDFGTANLPLLKSRAEQIINDHEDVIPAVRAESLERQLEPWHEWLVPAPDNEFFQAQAQRLVDA